MTDKKKNNKRLTAVQRRILFMSGSSAAPFIVIFLLMNFIFRWHLKLPILIGICFVIVGISFLMMKLSLKNNTFIKLMEKLQKEGYTDEYMEGMKAEIAKAERHMRLRDAEGYKAMHGFALLFRGELDEAYERLKSIKMPLLRKPMRSKYINNLIAVCFFLEKYDEVADLYSEHEKLIISDPGALMKRSLGMREYAKGRYENAVTIFIKLMELESKSDTLFSDLCLMKAMMQLDMYESSRPFLKFLERYKGLHQLNEIASEVQRKALAGLHSPHKNQKKQKKKH